MRRMTLVAVVAVDGARGARGRRRQLRGVKTSAQDEDPGEVADAEGGVLRRRRHAAGHRDAVRRAGPHAHDVGVPEEGHVRQWATAFSPRLRPNTGAGWYSLATGAWPGVHGSTNNTFHRNGQPFANRTAAFDPGVLQAESIAQSAERSGLKVAQVEWAGGRNATIDGPTIDFQSFFSGRGVATNFIGKAGDALFDNAANIAAFGLQFDHPAGYAGQAAVCRRGAHGGVRLDGVASADVQPCARDASPRDRLRRRQVRAERLDLRLARTTARRTTTRCSSRGRRAPRTRSAR